MATPIRQNIRVDPVMYAAIGISDQAAPRSIGRTLRFRPYRTVSTSPSAVRLAQRENQKTLL